MLSKRIALTGRWSWEWTKGVGRVAAGVADPARLDKDLAIPMCLAKARRLSSLSLGWGSPLPGGVDTQS